MLISEDRWKKLHKLSTKQIEEALKNSGYTFTASILKSTVYGISRGAITYKVEWSNHNHVVSQCEYVYVVHNDYNNKYYADI